jgi:probable rRNA maturation factor
VNEVEVSVRGSRSPICPDRLVAFCRKAMKALDIQRAGVSILLCDDKTIRSINKKFRGRNAATDVLSFSQAGGGEPAPNGMMGDIVISLDTLRRNASELGISQDSELKRLIVHGLLHLQGMDHGRGKGAEMLRLQEEILDSLRAPRILSPRRRR